jgi:hypothetical protein
MTNAPCGHQKCRAYQLTVSEFEQLGGETWTQSFRVKLGMLVNKRYEKLYGQKAPMVRASLNPRWRNKVGMYPCGLLEQAYRELTTGAEAERATGGS